MTRLASTLAIAVLIAAPSVVKAADAGGDAAQGKQTFAVCAACHQVGPDAKPLIGPPLNGVVGHKAGNYPGFEYSAGLKNSNITWTKQNLDKWLAGPQQMIPGTKMIFPGLPDAQSRENVIAYLATLGPDGKPTGGK